MDLQALLELVPEQYRKALTEVLVQIVSRYALAEVNGLALLADLEALKRWASSPLASPEPSACTDSISAYEVLR